MGEQGPNIEALEGRLKVIESGFKGVRLLRKEINMGSYQFTMEHAAYYLMQQETQLIENADQVNGPGTQHGGFSRQYR